MYSTTASRVSFSRDGDVQSETHGGTGWELMKGSQITTQNDTEFQVGLSITSGGAIALYVDEVWLSLGQSEITEIPYLELRNWDHAPPVA